MSAIARLRDAAARRPGSFAAFLAALSGLLLTACQPPWGQAWLAPLALAPLLIAVLIGRRPFLTGWLAGAVHFTTLLSWVYTVMHRHGPLPGWISALLTLLLGAVLGLYVALFASATALCARRRGPAFALGAAPLLWVGTEILRAKWLTGFPWCPLGNALWEHPRLAQPAGIGQVWLLSLILAACSTFILRLLPSQPPVASRKFPVPTALILLIWLWHAAFPEGPSGFSEPIRVRIVQPAIPQDQKWDPAFSREILDRLVRLSTGGGPDGPSLILYPESSLPDVEPRELNLTLEKISRETGARLLLGTEYVRGERVYNAAVLLGRSPIPPAAAPFPPPVPGPLGLVSSAETRFTLPEEGFYAKRHLAPFGEYVPWRRWLFFAKKLTHGIGDFTPGVGAQPIRDPSTAYGLLICYETIFPDLAAEAARRTGVSWLVNISNDAWFDGTGAKRQLLSMSQMRVYETGIPMIRSANTGISGILSPDHHELMLENQPIARDFYAESYPGRPIAVHFRSGWEWIFPLADTLLLFIALIKPIERR